MSVRSAVGVDQERRHRVPRGERLVIESIEPGHSVSRASSKLIDEGMARRPKSLRIVRIDHGTPLFNPGWEDYRWSSLGGRGRGGSWVSHPVRMPSESPWKGGYSVEGVICCNGVERASKASICEWLVDLIRAAV